MTPEWQVKNRVFLMQIDAVKPETGQVSAVAVGFHKKEERLELPLPGFSLNRTKSSWIRYMPQRGDFVLVGYDNRDQAFILGYTAGIPENVGLSISGAYRQVTAAKEAGEVIETTRSNTGAETEQTVKAGLGDFLALQPGEYDLRSSGGATIYGNSDGSLYLAGGARSWVRLDKKNQEVHGEAPLFYLTSTGTELRSGLIKRRVLPTDYKESSITSLGHSTNLAIDPTGTREWHTHIEHLTPAGVSIALGDKWFGGVRSNLGIPIDAGPVPGVPLRELTRVYVPGTLSAAPVKLTANEVAIDILGNTKVQHGPSTTLVQVGKDSTAPATALQVEYTTVTAKAAASVALEAPRVALGGAEAVESGVKGTTTIAALLKLSGALTRVATELSVAANAVPGGQGIVLAAQDMLAACLTFTAEIAPANTLSTKVFLE